MRLISPTEPLWLKATGKSSSLPEKLGVDILWPRYRAGVQRKEFNDLLASLGDRLTREISQMQQLRTAILLVEGRGRWTTDGELVGYRTRFTRKQLWGLQLSMQAKGIWIITTDNAEDTLQALAGIEAWIQKPRHDSLERRKKAGSSNGWGVSAEDRAVHLLQSYDGIGPERARKILKHFGACPVGWTVGLEELMKVPGVGRKTAEKWVRTYDQA